MSMLSLGIETRQPHQLRKVHGTLLLTVLVLNVCDLLLTQLIIGSGWGHEGNGLMASFIMSPWAWVVKVGIPLGVLLASTLRSRRMPTRRFQVIAAGVVTLIYVAVVSWNAHFVLPRVV